MLRESPGQNAKIRGYFSENLRLLCDESDLTVSEICSELQIHRTQFARFLTGVSFPRPDTLHHLCRIFRVDARILTSSLREFRQAQWNELPQSLLGDVKPASQSVLPDGFYCEWRKLMPCNKKYSYVVHILFVGTRPDGHRTTRLFHQPAISRADGVIEEFSSLQLYKGMAFHQTGGCLVIDSASGFSNCSVTFFEQGTRARQNLYLGHKKSLLAIRTVPRLGKSATVLEYLPEGFRQAMRLRRLVPYRLSEETPDLIRLTLDELETTTDLM